MKKTITLISTMLACITMQAQTTLTIETTPGELKNVMTQEQMSTVKELTIVGGLNKDDLYQIHQNMPRLSSLDITNVSLEIIPKKSFYQNKNIQIIQLSSNLQCIEDSAFYDTDIRLILTGVFPKLGVQAITYISVSPENKYCKMVSNMYDSDGIYSIDEKILYYFMPIGLDSSIIEGTEIIKSRAFEDCWIRRLTFPSTLKEIEENVFTNININGITGIGDSGPIFLAFKSQYPPILGKGTFTDGPSPASLFIDYIFVPKNSVDLYKNADPQWSVFEIVQEGDQPQGIESVSNPNLSIIRSGNSWILNGQKGISKIEVFSTIGVIIFSTKCNDTQVEIPMGKTGEVVYARALYADNTTEVIKLIK